MAIFHFTASTGSRSGGQSASAKHDYITRNGRYTYRQGSDPCLYEKSGNMPAWASQDASLYWSAADEHERANGRLFKHLEIALLDELTLDQNKTLLARFVEEMTTTPDGAAPFEYAIHAGKIGKGHPENLHAHIMLSERILDGIDRTPETWFKRAATKEQDPAQYGARKTLHFKPEDWLANTRKRWAEVANESLAEAGHSVRIDHRTLNEQKYEALELGLFDRALELNRAPKRRVPRAAYEFELVTGEESAWRRENSDFLTTREEKEAEERKNFADLVEKMRSKVTELEEAQVEPAEEITPAKPKTIYQKPAPSMTDRMTAFFSSAAKTVIEKAKALSKSMAWAKNMVDALKLAPAKTDDAKNLDQVENFKPQTTTKPTDPVKLEFKDTQEVKDFKPAAVKEDETKKPDPVEPKPAEVTEEAQEVRRKRNSAPRKRQLKQDAPTPAVSVSQGEAALLMVAKLKNGVYPKAIREIETPEAITSKPILEVENLKLLPVLPEVPKPEEVKEDPKPAEATETAQDVKQEEAPSAVSQEETALLMVEKLKYQKAMDAIKASKPKARRRRRRGDPEQT